MRTALLLLQWLLIGLAGIGPQAARGQSWPVKPVRLVVPYPPGGSTDITARLISDAVGKSLGQAVVVENRSSLTGLVGMEQVARAEPDGYTFIIAGDSALYQPAIRPNLNFSISSFAPVSLVVVQPIVLATGISREIDSLATLITMAKAKPDALTYGTAGIGGTQNLAAALLWNAADVRLLHVPYAGGAQVATALAGGQIHAAFIGSGPAAALAKSGKIKLIAVTTKQRAAAMSAVPTVAESGYPDFEVSQWFGILATSGTAPAIVARLQSEVTKAVATPEIREKLINSGFEPVGSTSQVFAARINVESKLWAKAVKELGMKPME